METEIAKLNKSQRNDCLNAIDEIVGSTDWLESA